MSCDFSSPGWPLFPRSMADGFFALLSRKLSRVCIHKRFIVSFDQGARCPEKLKEIKCAVILA